MRSDSLDSILTESTSYEMMFAIKDMVKPLKDIVTRYIPDITLIPLEQGIEWLPSWKASPSKRKLSKDQKGSPFAMLHHELEAFIAYMPDQSSFERFGPKLLSATFEVFGLPLWTPGLRYPFSNEIELSYRSEKDTRIFVEKARAELPLIPQDVASAHFSEYTLLRAWMKQSVVERSSMVLYQRVKPPFRGSFPLLSFSIAGKLELKTPY